QDRAWCRSMSDGERKKSSFSPDLDEPWTRLCEVGLLTGCIGVIKLQVIETCLCRIQYPESVNSRFQFKVRVCRSIHNAVLAEEFRNQRRSYLRRVFVDVGIPKVTGLSPRVSILVVSL